MNEDDYKNLLGAYQKKSMDLFTQLVVAEARIQLLESKLSESNEIIKKLTEKVNESKNYEEFESK
jgi:hypothetical protein